MVRIIKKNFRPMLTVVVLAAIGLFVGGYLLVNQGARLPLLSEKPIRIKAVLDNAQAVTPGQGQTVQVAGVQVGKIATVDLVDGRAVLGLDIEPKYIKSGLIHRDDHALLRPRTPLKDMYLQVLRQTPNGPPIRKGDTIPVQNTMSDVDLDEILSSLDGRTRDYLTLLLDGTGKGLKQNGSNLAEVFRRFEPTFKDLGRVNRSVALERTALRSVVSSLAGLNTKLAERPEELSGLVTAANTTFGAFASEDQNLRATVAELPSTLRTATQTLSDLRPFANELGPATRALTPAIQALDRANTRVRPFAKEATPIIRDRIRPFTKASRPLVRDLAPASRDLAATFPDLLRDTRVINRFFNMLAFNPNGREAPGAANREEGYLYWLAWTAHQGANLINVDDANGPMRAILPTGLCSTLTSLVTAQPELEFAMGLSPVLATACNDPQTRSVEPDKVKKSVAREVKVEQAQARALKAGDK